MSDRSGEIPDMNRRNMAKVMHLRNEAEKSELRSEAGVHEENSMTDELTGLLNLRGWNQKVIEYSKHARRTGEEFTYVGVDFDNLKMFNDTQGHVAGDGLLIGFAKVMKKVGRDTDIFARVGGDEFAVLLPATSLEKAEKFKQRIIDESLKVGIKLSIGLGESLKDADEEMYRMKKLHKNAQ